jgi:hypothetical protein
MLLSCASQTRGKVVYKHVCFLLGIGNTKDLNSIKISATKRILKSYLSQHSPLDYPI